VTWTAYMQSIVNASSQRSDASLSLSQRFFMIALAFRWRSAFLVTYAVEFLCLSTAKLLVLDRMTDFAAGGALKHWAAGRRIVMAAVVVGNSVGLVANAAAAVHVERAAEFTLAVSADLAANNSFVQNL
jgi:hypothetical protein